MTIEEKYNLSDLYEKIETLLDRKLTWKPAEIRDDFIFGSGIYVESDDIKEAAGIVANALNYFKIVSFDADFEDAKKFGLIAGITLAFEYDFTRGPSDNIALAMCHLNKDNTWSVKSMYEDKKRNGND